MFLASEAPHDIVERRLEGGTHRHRLHSYFILGTASGLDKAASNFFELAVAVAISLFSLKSAATRATFVGVLQEVTMMVRLVWIATRTKKYVDRRHAGAKIKPGKQPTESQQSA